MLGVVERKKERKKQTKKQRNKERNKETKKETKKQRKRNDTKKTGTSQIFFIDVLICLLLPDTQSFLCYQVCPNNLYFSSSFSVKFDLQ